MEGYRRQITKASLSEQGRSERKIRSRRQRTDCVFVVGLAVCIVVVVLCVCVVILCVFVVLCVHCCFFYFGCRTAG